MHVDTYNKEGRIVSYISLPDDLEYINGRTSRSGDVYYKGVGCPYNQHSSLHPSEFEKIISPSKVFYYGYDVENRNWTGKAGIFQDRYQPYFSDFIGTCGPKEKSIISNSKQFELSAIKVEDCIEYDKEFNQQYFILSYIHERTKFVEGGSPSELVNLMSYMIYSDWNFPWDKCSISDVSSKGFVTDVADMFKSNKLTHKIGTVYSILFSLHQLNLQKYIDFSRYCNAAYSGVSDIPIFSNQILKGIGCNVDAVLVDNYNNTDLYINIVGNWLMRGKNCAAVEKYSFNDEIAEQYISRFTAILPENKRQIVRGNIND